MSKKFLRKNEFRVYNNPNNPNDLENGHPSYISGKYKHMFRRNTITHSKFANGLYNIPMDENPNKNRKPYDNRITRISQPGWKHEKYYGPRLSNWRWSPSNRRKIRRFNKSFK